MLQKPNRSLRLLLLTAHVGIGICGQGCASFDMSATGESPPLPATMTGLRDEIDAQRALLKDFVSQNDKGEVQRGGDADQLIAIAERLRQLRIALETLELEHEADPVSR